MLNKALNILTSNRINLTRIASRPSKFVKDNWRQVDFFIDFEGKGISQQGQATIKKFTGNFD